MYLAPLNYDRFFKKVFSQTHIAKAFLEDFLDTQIEEIKLLERTHLLTNKAMKVEMDFRCKINGSYVIVDMQQWYKPDVVKRFYLYHCASTALQLEDLPEKNLLSNPKHKKSKDVDYRLVEPVLTLVWMVDDSLGFKNNFMVYTTAPEYSLDFICNQPLWDKNDLTELIKERNVVYQAMQNTHKDLNFLQKNRLIFMFQNNIVKDDKFTKYRKWFEFAEKTKNKENKSKDFITYKKDVVFKEVMKIIVKKALDAEDLKYIESEEENIVLFQRHLDGVREDLREEVKEEVRGAIKEEVREEVKEEVREEVKEEVREEVKEEVREEVKEEVREEVKEEERNALREETILKLFGKGKQAAEIADLLDFSLEVVQKAILKAKK